jgi:uncharacterized protein involved in type VI secretion and phage assembly
VSGINEQLLQDLLERVSHRYYGKYRGTVTSVDAATLRVKAKVPAVLGKQETGWCVACVPYAGKDVGIAFLPEEGSGVWIEFEGGDVSYPIWSGCYWRDGEQPQEAQPAVKAIITKSGHKILLDDDGGTITLTDSHNNKVTLGSDGITLERGASKLALSDSEVNVNNGALEIT